MPGFLPNFDPTLPAEVIEPFCRIIVELPLFYGGEDTALPPDMVISAQDGRGAVELAERVFRNCKKLLA